MTDEEMTVSSKSVQLNKRWTLGEPLGAGGYGQVVSAIGEDGTLAAVKLVPKRPGASRELLFVDLSLPGQAVRNVVPVLDSGETDDSYVIVMPLAEESLRDRLKAVGGPLPLEQALTVLTDVASALADLDGRVVHRDLKPENVLFVDGSWCLADFGISRYAEAVTATETHKSAGSREYSAPERWRLETATAAVDVYALGVMGYELLAGELPFPGPDFRDQHLHGTPPPLPTASPRLAALIEECLYKSPQARPVPANLLARLQRAADTTLTPGAAALAGAYQQVAAQRRTEEAAASRARTEQERREGLADAASRSHERTSATLLETVIDLAPSVTVTRRPEGWSVELNNVRFGLSSPVPFDGESWGDFKPAIDVVAACTVSIVIPRGSSGYEGRSHSLYYCDAQRAGQYAWFETAFMETPGGRSRRQRGLDPFSLQPGESAGAALSNVMAETQVAWPFTELVTGEPEEFVDRWVGWFGDAVQGLLSRPMMMPERRPEGTWRR